MLKDKFDFYHKDYPGIIYTAERRHDEYVLYNNVNFIKLIYTSDEFKLRFASENWIEIVESESPIFVNDEDLLSLFQSAVKRTEGKLYISIEERGFCIHHSEFLEFGHVIKDKLKVINIVNALVTLHEAIQPEQVN